MPVAIGPQQRDHIDAAHDAPVLARPLPMHQFHMTCVRLAQRRVINDQDALGELDLGARFLSQLVRIGPQPIQQAVNRIVRGRFVLLGLHPRRFRAGEDARAGDREIDVVLVTELGIVHTALDYEKR